MGDNNSDEFNTVLHDLIEDAKDDLSVEAVSSAAAGLSEDELRRLSSMEQQHNIDDETADSLVSDDWFDSVLSENATLSSGIEPISVPAPESKPVEEVTVPSKKKDKKNKKKRKSIFSRFKKKNPLKDDYGDEDMYAPLIQDDSKKSDTDGLIDAEVSESLNKITDELGIGLDKEDSDVLADVISDVAGSITSAEENVVAEESVAAEENVATEETVVAEPEGDSKKKSKKKKKASKEKKNKKKLKDRINDIFFEEMVEPEIGKKDENQTILDEMYADEGKDSGGKKKKVKGKKPKKGKKGAKEGAEGEEASEEKPKKEKKKKEKKPKKPKEPVNPADLVKFKPVKVIVFITFVAAVVIGVLVWTEAFNYYVDVTDAKKYYKSGNYEAAYEIVSGRDMKKKDEQFAQRLRQIMVVKKQYNSYYQYETLGDDLKALDSLLKGVRIHNENIEDDKKLGVYDETSKIYQDILAILSDEYMIGEADAMSYSRIENYMQYYEILKVYGGTVEDDVK